MQLPCEHLLRGERSNTIGSKQVFCGEQSKNTRVIHFYHREGFEIQGEGLDKVTGEKEYLMMWQQ